jgi:hypothetical protein
MLKKVLLVSMIAMGVASCSSYVGELLKGAGSTVKVDVRIFELRECSYPDITGCEIFKVQQQVAQPGPAAVTDGEEVVATAPTTLYPKAAGAQTVQVFQLLVDKELKLAASLDKQIDTASVCAIASPPEAGSAYYLKFNDKKTEASIFAVKAEKIVCKIPLNASLNADGNIVVVAKDSNDTYHNAELKELVAIIKPLTYQIIMHKTLQ